MANPQPIVQAATQQIEDLLKVRNDELVLLGQIGRFSHLMVSQDAIAGEIARRSIDALELNREATAQSTSALREFKDQSKIASDRLEGLTRWLIAFTVVLAFLTVVVVAHDLTR